MPSAGVRKRRSCWKNECAQGRQARHCRGSRRTDVTDRRSNRSVSRQCACSAALGRLGGVQDRDRVAVCDAHHLAGDVRAGRDRDRQREAARLDEGSDHAAPALSAAFGHRARRGPSAARRVPPQTAVGCSSREVRPSKARSRRRGSDDGAPCRVHWDVRNTDPSELTRSSDRRPITPSRSIADYIAIPATGRGCRSNGRAITRICPTLPMDAFPVSRSSRSGLK